MLYKNYLIILISLIMFSFFEKAEAKYEQLFFDLNIRNIDNEVINLNKFKGKVVLLVKKTGLKAPS